MQKHYEIQIIKNIPRVDSEVLYMKLSHFAEMNHFYSATRGELLINLVTNLEV